MGTETEGPSGPARISSERGPTTPYRRPIPTGLLVIVGLFAILVVAAVGTGRTESAFAEATEGRCYRTGIGAVGMADWTRGTNVVNLIFPSGVRESYDINDLKEVVCPNTANAELGGHHEAPKQK